MKKPSKEVSDYMSMIAKSGHKKSPLTKERLDKMKEAKRLKVNEYMRTRCFEAFKMYEDNGHKIDPVALHFKRSKEHAYLMIRRHKEGFYLSTETPLTS